MPVAKPSPSKSMRRCLGENVGIASTWAVVANAVDWVRSAITTTEHSLLSTPAPRKLRRETLAHSCAHKRRLSPLQIVPRDQDEAADKAQMLKEGIFGRV